MIKSFVFMEGFPLISILLKTSWKSADQQKFLIQVYNRFILGLLCDLLWADPSTECNQWTENDRGVSYIFSTNEIKKFNEQNDIDLICRAHQVVEDGYEFFGDKNLLTLFSAPDYCGEYGNNASIMTVDENLICSFKILKPGP